MEFEESEIIDSNGEKYRVGTDQYGWFSIESGEMVWDEEGQVEYFAPYEDQRPVSFEVEGADQLATAIERFLR